MVTKCPQCGYEPLTDATDKGKTGTYCAFCETFYPVALEAGGLGMRIPDSIEPVVGWRAWYVYGNRIRSQGFGGEGSEGVWHPGQKVTAICTREGIKETGPFRTKAVHADADGIIPHSSCTCGYYAARSREHLLQLDNYHRYDKRGKPTIMGRVQMWGKVRVASNGWRAQFAKPIEFLIPYELWSLAHDLKDYEVAGVKLSLDNTLVMPEGDRWCKQCGQKLAPRAHMCECGKLVEGG